jgi:hypothetical protein
VVVVGAKVVDGALLGDGRLTVLEEAGAPVVVEFVEAGWSNLRQALRAREWQ